MAGELTIEQNTDGTATINFAGVGVYGGGSHTVGQAGDNVADNVAALQSAYGDRIGNIVSSELTGETQVSQATEAAGTDTTTSTTTTEQTEIALDPNFAQYVGQSENRVIDGIEIPYWVDDDYITSYVYSAKQGNPRGPNMREMTEMIAGVPVEQLYDTMDISEYSQFTNLSSQLLYGVVGSNTDTRNWQAITAAAIDPTTGKIDGNKLVATTQIATSQMYGGTTVSYQSGGYQTDVEGNTVIDANGSPVLLPPALYVVGGNGSILTSLDTNNLNGMINTLKAFGVQDGSWVDTVAPNMATSISEQGALNLRTIRDTYSPFSNYQAISNIQGLITGVAPTIDNFQIISGQTISGTGTGTETTQEGTSSTQVTGDQQQQQQTADNTSNVATQAIQTPVQLPQTVSYQMPQGYQGSGFLQTGIGTQPNLAAPMTGTFTKPADMGIMGYQPSQQYTIGQSTTQTQPTIQTPQYDVRMYRNNAGMTTSITFIDGKPSTPIPSGFYPVGQQPANQTPYVPQVNTSPQDIHLSLI